LHSHRLYALSRKPKDEITRQCWKRHSSKGGEAAVVCGLGSLSVLWYRLPDGHQPHQIVNGTLILILFFGKRSQYRLVTRIQFYGRRPAHKLFDNSVSLKFWKHENSEYPSATGVHVDRPKGETLPDTKVPQ